MRALTTVLLSGMIWGNITVWGQSPDPVTAAVNYAKENILMTQAATGTYVLDRRQILWPDEGLPGMSRFGATWPPGRIVAVATNTGLQLGSYDEARTCKVIKGHESCHLRPHSAVVAVGAPRVTEDSAYVQVHLWFHIGPPRTDQRTGEQFDIIHAQLLTLLVTRGSDAAWSVTRRVRPERGH